jgi:hypothetical protein
MASLKHLIRTVPAGPGLLFRQSIYGRDDDVQIVIDMLGLANAEIGDEPRFVFLGVYDAPDGKRRLPGIEQQDMAALKRRLQSLLDKAIEPKIHATVRALELQGRLVGFVRVEDCVEAPYLTKTDVAGRLPPGLGFIRRGAETVALTRSDLLRMFRDLNESQQSVAADASGPHAPIASPESKADPSADPSALPSADAEAEQPIPYPESEEWGFEELVESLGEPAEAADAHVPSEADLWLAALPQETSDASPEPELQLEPELLPDSELTLESDQTLQSDANAADAAAEAAPERVEADLAKRFDSPVIVRFQGNDLSDRIELPALSVRKLPSELAAERLRALLETKQQSRDVFGQTQSHIARLVHARHFGPDMPYHNHSDDSLVQSLETVEHDFRAADDHYLYEVRAHKLNLIVLNTLGTNLNNARLKLTLPRMAGLGISDRVYAENDNEIAPTAYPEVIETERATIVKTELGTVCRDDPTHAFREPIRLWAREKCAGRTALVNYELTADELDSAVIGSLTIDLTRESLKSV